MDPRASIATAILAALIAGRHADYKVDDSDIAKAVDVADRLHARLGETEPKEGTESAEEARPPAYRIDGLSDEQGAALAAAFPTLEALDAATDPQIDAVKGIGEAAVKAIRAAREAAKVPPGREVAPIDPDTGEGL